MTSLISSGPGQHLENSEARPTKNSEEYSLGPFFCLTSFLIDDRIVRLIFSFYSQTSFLSPRRCSGCTKKRSLLTNSFFEEFPRVAPGTLLLSIYYFITDDSLRITVRRLDVNHGLISNIFRRLQDVCLRDLADRPIIPFGSPGSVIKCDESKFNHKPNVNFFLFFFSSIFGAKV